MQNIRALRRSKDYSQNYMCTQLQTSQRAYSQIENGHTNLTFETAIRIAEILEVGIEELVR